MICKSLLKNTILTELDLGNDACCGNSFGVEGAKKISELILTNTTLTKLCLYGENDYKVYKVEMKMRELKMIEMKEKYIYNEMNRFIGWR